MLRKAVLLVLVLLMRCSFQCLLCHLAYLWISDCKRLFRLMHVFVFSTQPFAYIYNQH
jgi:hypothetical protein